jgi:hypothetical protein
MAETPVIAAGFIKFRDNLELRLVDALHDHLGDTVPAMQGVILPPEIDHRDLDFAAIIGVDGSG